MFFNVIASGSKGNATIVANKNTVILIDMGITFSRLEEGMKEIKLEPNQIDGALFTHDHSDHIKGLKFIPIKKQYALEGTLPSSGHNIVELFKPFNIGDFKITPIETSHDATNPCGFVLEEGGEKLTYITDTGMFLDKDLEFCKNSDYIILESNHDIQMLLKSDRSMDLKTRILSTNGHLSNEDSALAAKEMLGPKTKEIVLAHISEECDTPELALEAYDKVFRYFGINPNNYNIRVANQWKSTIGGHYEN